MRGENFPRGLDFYINSFRVYAGATNVDGRDADVYEIVNYRVYETYSVHTLNNDIALIGVSFIEESKGVQQNIAINS